MRSFPQEPSLYEIDMTPQIPDTVLERLKTAYTESCLDRNTLAYHFTNWKGDQARRLAEGRNRLLTEFDEEKETSMEDVLGVELAECYKAMDEGNRDEAKRRIALAAAILVRGMRHLDLLYPDAGSNDEDSNG